MNEHALAVLGFPRVRTLLAQGARTPQGEDLCRALAPLPGRQAALEALDELESLSDLEPRLGPPPLSGVHRIEAVLDASRKDGACLEIEAFLALRDTVGACHRLLEYLEDAAAEGTLLGRYAGRMRPLWELADRFERTFGPRGEILDGASPALLALREEQRRLRGRILRVLEGLLGDAALDPVVQDEFITLRGGRYVVPLRTDFRGYLKGIVHDRSRTGSTFFVEPLETVELNNQFGVLREDEEAEVRRILLEITRSVGEASGALKGNLAVVAHVDALASRLVLAKRLRAVRPGIPEAPVLELREARHPLLEVSGDVAVVPVDILLEPPSRWLLVTGANAGGKTVALKTAGLLTAMARCGLFVPAAEGSRVGWFPAVYADIGDEQDIDRHLSTFSAHVGNLRDIVEKAESGCFALLDELGTGTDPREGLALAAAVVETLLERGACLMATTHLAGLKAFARSRPDGRSAAVAFDPSTGEPQYRLEYGRSGASNALEVAERLGMPSDVLARARRYAAGDEGRGGELLRGLEEAEDRAREAAERAEDLRSDWEARNRQQEELVREARRERDVVRAEFRREVRSMVEEVRREMRDAVRRLSDGAIGRAAAEAEVASLQRLAEERLGPEETEAPPGGLDAEAVPGMRVHVASLGREGEVQAVEPDGRRAVVRLGTLRVTVPLDDLRAPVEARPPAQPAPRVRVDAEAGASDVNVIGSTVEEALVSVDRALDRALVAGVRGFRVVHGRGTGTLRRAVREHLASAPHVREVRPEGDAVTWIDLG